MIRLCCDVEFILGIMLTILTQHRLMDDHMRNLFLSDCLFVVVTVKHEHLIGCCRRCGSALQVGFEKGETAFWVG